MIKKFEKTLRKIKSIPNLDLWILVGILIAGFLVRLYKIDSAVADWHSFRQADTASVAREYTKNGINLLYPKYHDISRIQSGMFNPEGWRFVEFPLYNALIALFTYSFSSISLEAWGRLLSVFSAVLSSYLLFLLGKKYISVWGGILAAFFYLFTPYNIFFTRVILPEPMAVMFGLSSLYLFDKFLEKEKLALFYISMLMFSISVLIKPYTIFYGVPMLILAHQKFNLARIYKQKEFWVAGLIAFAPLLLWRLWVSQYPEGIPFWKWTLNGDGIRFQPAFWYWIFGERLVKLILGFWGIIPFFFGLISINTKNKFIHYFGLGVLTFVIVVATANVKHDYYQTIAVPAISLLTALGFWEMWNNPKFNSKVVKIFAVFSVLIMLFAGAFQVKEFYKINHPEIIEAGNAVDRLTPKDAVVIASYWGDTAFLYQTKRIGYPHVELPIEELISEGAQYYASVDLGSPQTREFMEKFETIERTEKYVILDLRRELK